MDEPVVFKAFEGLVGDESKVDSTAYSKERVDVVQRARNELQASQVSQQVSMMQSYTSGAWRKLIDVEYQCQDGLHRIIKDNFPKVSLQYQSAEEIQTKLKESQGSLQALEESMRSTVSTCCFCLGNLG